MIYNEKYVFIVYIISALLLIGFICFVYFVNVGDYLHSYKSAGTICAYYGIVAPEGWVICNGENGTPDLRGKFVYGGNTFSQILSQSYKNVVDDDERDFYNFTHQIEGGNNYQTLTTKTKNIDNYKYVKPNTIPYEQYYSILTDFDYVNIGSNTDANNIVLEKMIATNPNIITTKPVEMITLNQVKQNDEDVEVFKAEIDPTKTKEDIQTIKQNNFKKRALEVRKEIKEHLGKDVLVNDGNGSI